MVGFLLALAVLGGRCDMAEDVVVGVDVGDGHAGVVTAELLKLGFQHVVVGEDEVVDPPEAARGRVAVVNG